MKSFIQGVVAAMSMLACAGAAEWLTDPEAAMTKAEAEGKAVLIDFTGSDWCHYCIRLRNEVLDTPGFEAYAKDKFVLVEVDVPHHKADMDPALRQRNKELCAQYRVQGFPTLLVLTPRGQVVGGMSGFHPQLEQVRQPLDAAYANMETLRQAESATGEERVELLRQAYMAIPAALRGASSLQQELMELDAGFAAQIKEQRAAEQQMREIRQRLSACSGDTGRYLAQLRQEMEQALPANKVILQYLQERMETMLVYSELNALKNDPAAALAYLDSKLQKAEGSLRASVLGLKGRLLLQTAKTLDDLQAAKAAFDELLQAVPGDTELRRRVEEVFSHPEKLLDGRQKQACASGLEIMSGFMCFCTRY